MIQTKASSGQSQAASPKDLGGVLTATAKKHWRSGWSVAADQGLLRLLMPEQIGGTGLDAQAFVRFMMELGQGCQDNGLAMGLNSHVWTVQQTLVRFGSDAQRDLYLPALMSGQAIGAFALTEKRAGSDALSMDMTASPKDGGYVLNGTKCFVGMGPVCDIAIVFAKTDPSKGRWGVSAFLLDKDDPGFERLSKQEKMGLTSVPLGKLQLNDCWVPSDRLLGHEGMGGAIIQTVLDWERSFILASQVGAMERQLAECTDFCKSRTVFGQNIASYQSVSNRLADMRVRIETSRLMVEKAARLYDANASLTQYAAMTNLHVSEAFLASSMDAMRIFAGRGYMAGATTATDLQDATGGILYSGTSDIQRQIISAIEQKSRPLSPEPKDRGR